MLKAVAGSVLGIFNNNPCDLDFIAARIVSFAETGKIKIMLFQ